MAGAVNTTWRASTPESIDADLATLWRDASVDGPVSRALMSNLVVVSPHRTFSDIEELARRHPGRTILLSYTSGAERESAPEGARVGLLTFGEGQARYGLELIAVHTTCAAASLPSIVRRLTIGSVPTTIWWSGDLSEAVPPAEITALGRQLVYNSARWRNVKDGISAAAAVLRQPQAPCIADVNWRRIAPLRDATVHALATEPGARGVPLASARVTYAGGEAAAAWLLAGWLAARTSVVPVVQEGEGHLVTLALGGEGWTIDASLTEHSVEVKSARPSFGVPLPSETEAGAVAAELLSLASDSGLCDALRALSERPPASL